MTSNLLKYRLFPRYDISKLSFCIQIQDQNPIVPSTVINLLDVSLSGIRLRSSHPLSIINEQVTLHITSENFKFSILSQFVWSGKYFDDSTHYGLKFFFDNINTLEGWIGFIKALHYLSLKSSFTVPDPVKRLTE
jgi:PilZ domain